jgi:hypothetical protein
MMAPAAQTAMVKGQQWPGFPFAGSQAAFGYGLLQQCHGLIKTFRPQLQQTIASTCGSIDPQKANDRMNASTLAALKGP